jgi:hypothetical protein
MYPNQAPPQNLGFFIPPPMVFTNQPQHQNMNQNKNSNDMSEMLADILRSKPNFGGNVFEGPIYQSKWK